MTPIERLDQIRALARVAGEAGRPLSSGKILELADLSSTEFHSAEVVLLSSDLRSVGNFLAAMVATQKITKGLWFEVHRAVGAAQEIYRARYERRYGEPPGGWQ